MVITGDTQQQIVARPYAEMPLGELIDQIGFAYSDDVMPEFELVSELARRAEASEPTHTS